MLFSVARAHYKHRKGGTQGTQVLFDKVSFFIFISVFFLLLSTFCQIVYVTRGIKIARKITLPYKIIITNIVVTIVIDEMGVKRIINVIIMMMMKVNDVSDDEKAW